MKYARILSESRDDQIAKQTIADILKNKRRYLREGYPYTIKSASRLGDICVQLGKDTTRLSTSPPPCNSEDDHKPTPFEILLQTREEAEEVRGYDDPELLVLKSKITQASIKSESS